MENFVRPSSPPKYFALDVDGTFYAFDEDSYAKNRKAFRKLVEAGYVPFLCTGRPLLGVFEDLKDLYTDGIYNGFPGVYQNGAIVYNHHGDLIILKSFDADFIGSLCNILVQHDLRGSALFLSANGMHSLSTDSRCLQILKTISTVTAELDIVSPDDLKLVDILQIFVVDFHNLAPYIAWKENVDCVTKHSHCGITTINPPGITKEAGIRALMKEANVSTKDCAFIGDGDNDIEAMELADYSFAVGNADDSVKAHAKYVLEETNEEGAFAKAVSLLYGIETDLTKCCTRSN
ncbi:HAD like protein [Babesia gibsoni]|uniref:HAD like protein n=1 Tax=Babesia gibsoni TaxID=33632 RepID=A0AAD8LJ74_BABGI|nr:HAD like protein [Babesia gibsoni]